LVTNPVDPLTYFVQKEIDFFKNVIGVASSLDSSRLRYLLAKELGLQQNEITNVMVLGEHDDSMVPIFSKIRCHNKPVTDLLNSEQLEKITVDLRGYWKILRNFKGPSLYGIAKNTYDVLKSIISKKELLIPASVLLNGEYGVSDVCMGVPIKINKEMKIQEIDLENSELDALQKSANVIKKNIKKLRY
jgi:malate dehydrogenase